MKALKIKENNKYRNWIQKVSIIFLLFFITQVSFALYETQGHKLVTKIDQMLIENNYCDNEKDCVKKEHAFWSGHDEKGFYINLYGISDPKIISKINVLTTIFYFKNKQRIWFKSHFYKTTHRNTNQPIFGMGGDKPFIYLELNKKGE